MKILARFVCTAAGLAALLAFAGCTTKQTARSAPSSPAFRITVVESSPDLTLSAQQVDDLKKSVKAYLEQQGLDRDGEYYVRVNFTPDKPEAEAAWAVVRIQTQPKQTFTLLAAYPGADDYYPYDFYRNGYYNPAYAGFSHWGYYDPFDYNYGGYSRPVPPRDHNRPDKPGDKPNHPTGTRTRWDHPPRTDADQPRGAYPPRTANPERWARERNEPRDGGRSYSPGNSSYTPPPERVSSPPSYSPPPSFSPPPAPARSEPSPSVRDESSRFAPQTNEK